jgi:alpha-mannosidase
VSEHALLVYGIGDGGGGPGAEHLERLARIRNLAGLSPVTQEPAAAFFEKWRRQADRFPTWVGELYLERHQGTLTTNARNKRYNRKLELALRELEWTSVLATVLAGAAYPARRLEALWREALLYQFHDILPGSSIKRVYDESVARYREMLHEVEALIAENDASIAGDVDTGEMASPVLVQNSLSWERTEWVQVDDRWLRVTVPPMGYTVVDVKGCPPGGSVARQSVPDCQSDTSGGDLPGTLSAGETHLENDLLSVEFAADGSIVSLYDKRAGREALPEGQAANRLLVYRDLGDAWDFPMDYAEQDPRALELVSAVARVDGPRAVLEQVYELGHSRLAQEIVLMAGSARLDFRSRLRWREPCSMLRVRFPVAVHAAEVTYEIQFGHIRRPTHRNTTWDLARDEVAAHRWVDLSQRDYGLALLNDCKYGHRVKGNVLDLDLLRSVPYPGPRLVQDDEVAPGEPHHAYTDQCDHTFTYALYPHLGDHVEGRVVQAGYALNVPLRVTPLQPQPGDRPTEASFLQVSAPNVVVEAIKQAEDLQPREAVWIVRLYECHGASARTTLRFGFPVDTASEVNLMEEALAPLRIYEGRISLEFRPFEVKTVRLARRI